MYDGAIVRFDALSLRELSNGFSIGLVESEFSGVENDEAQRT